MIIHEVQKSVPPQKKKHTKIHSCFCFQTIIGTDIADLLLVGHEPTTHEYTVSGLRVTQSQSYNSTPDQEEDSRGSSPAVRVSADRTVISAAQLLEESTDHFRHLLLYGRKKVITIE